MKRIEKTVFISYRRANASWALAIFQTLKQSGYDVFFDFKSIGSGDFEQIILENVKARAHFLVLLTPSALERCDEPGDWLRREIETAIDFKRNIVPLMLEGFDFEASIVHSYLKGKLATLKRYNALRVTADYFEEGMTRLREQYLDIPIETVLQPPSVVAYTAVKEQQAAANVAPKVQESELLAQQWFEKGYEAYRQIGADYFPGRMEEVIEYFDRAITINPNFADAYKYRGLARMKKMLRPDFDGAIRDFATFILLRPGDADAYYLRAWAYENSGNLKAAASDYTNIIHLNPIDTKAYYSRAKAREKVGDFDGAIDDLSEGTRVYGDYLLKMRKLNSWWLPAEEVTRTYHESKKIIRDLKSKQKNRK